MYFLAPGNSPCSVGINATRGGLSSNDLPLGLRVVAPFKRVHARANFATIVWSLSYTGPGDSSWPGTITLRTPRVTGAIQLETLGPDYTPAPRGIHRLRTRATKRCFHNRPLELALPTQILS